MGNVRLYNVRILGCDVGECHKIDSMDIVVFAEKGSKAKRKVYESCYALHKYVGFRDFLDMVSGAWLVDDPELLTSFHGGMPSGFNVERIEYEDEMR